MLWCQTILRGLLPLCTTQLRQVLLGAGPCAHHACHHQQQQSGLGNVTFMIRYIHLLAAHLDERLACDAQVVSAIVARRSASIMGSASEDDAGTRMADRAELTVIMARLQVRRPSTACQCW